MISKRNGKIDLLRFVFAIVIMLHHLGLKSPLFGIGGIHFQLINAGGYAVVFYFLTSGWLIAKDAEKNPPKDNTWESISGQTIRYMWKRYKYFITWFLPAFALNMIWDCMNNGIVEMLKHSFYNIPNVFMLQNIGFGFSDVYTNGFYVNASWYLSALLICSLIVYPMLLWNRNLFIRIIAPLISVYGLYILLNKYGQLRLGNNIWYPITIICMGCIACEVSKVVSDTDTFNLHKGLIGSFEIMVYLLVIVYICSDLPGSFEYPLTLLLILAVSISFSGLTYRSFFDNRLFSLLGRASFPLYMLHSAVGLIYRKLLEQNSIDYNSIGAHLILYAICLSVSIAAELVYEYRIKKTRAC